MSPCVKYSGLDELCAVEVVPYWGLHMNTQDSRPCSGTYGGTRVKKIEVITKEPSPL